VIIQVSMTVGETAPIMYTGAVTYVAFLPESFTDETMAMSLHLYNLSFVMQDVPEALPYGVALTLIGVVLALNSTSIAFRMYLRGQKKW
jgi:phosphate transport system permease protein